MPKLRHPDVEGTFDADERVVAHWRKAGWAPVDEQPKPKRTRRRRTTTTPRPAPAGAQDGSVAGQSVTDTEE